MNILRIIFSSVPYVMFVIILSRHLGFEFAKTYYWWFAAFFVIGLIGKFAMHLAAKKKPLKKRQRKMRLSLFIYCFAARRVYKRDCL
ncbi:hypothetical protein ACTWKC_10440 [Bacillus sp. 4A_MP3]